MKGKRGPIERERETLREKENAKGKGKRGPQCCSYLSLLIDREKTLLHGNRNVIETLKCKNPSIAKGFTEN